MLRILPYFIRFHTDLPETVWGLSPLLSIQCSFPLTGMPLIFPRPQRFSQWMIPAIFCFPLSLPRSLWSSTALIPALSRPGFIPWATIPCMPYLPPNIRFCMLLLYPLWTSRAHCLTVRRLPSSVSLSYCSADFCSASIWQIITTVRFLPLPARYLPAQRRKNLPCGA